MKLILSVAVLLSLCLLLSACQNEQMPELSSETAESSAATIQSTQNTSLNESFTATEHNDSAPHDVNKDDQSKQQSEEPREKTLRMMIEDTPVSVSWEENETIEALKEICRDQTITVASSMYGGFEQVGYLSALPHHDVQTETSPGDIVLYSGDQLVVFYGSNSWAYTKLGHITDQTAEELSDLLSKDHVTISLYLE